ncbi:hypothetical protein T9A_01848 [Alcanivorax jadensis T9]|jgi:uncharacterized GH25 family protein|uniref:Uncharacterized protein n=1 Tax=Alcanivorax jadensis T9 TaxID=1177181 RepID=A0ABR4WC99_9GAMM|nr:DUF4198 domain-containing protein [Alcanivorax jadensis]KGD60988.1 hypothetical protein T9A_01848 [Alcanivorax jadensis T9]
MNITLKRIGMLSLLAMALPAQAHKLWLLPSHTSVSEPQWVTVDASISNEIFGVERAYPLDYLEVSDPDGQAATVENRLEGHRRSVFDVKLNKPGSYRIAVAKPGYFLMYQVDGERKRARGMDADKLLAQLPDNASDVTLSEVHNRLETVVTLGAPTAIAPTGKGMELEMLTHPNDLYAGETAQWRLLVDGEPASGVEMELVPGGTRYRDSQDNWTVTSDDNGMLSITWPQAGRYYLEAASSDDKVSNKKADQRRLQYLGTVEVLPM